jgi:hypothetical protein
LLDIQLERSAHAPLDLLIRVISGWSGERHFDALLQSLITHCERWRTVQFHFETHPHRAFTILERMPLLEELIFSGPAAEYSSNYDFLHGTPNLRKVTLSDQGRPSLPLVRLPWAQPTTYKATYDAKTQFQNVSAAAGTLVKCDLGFPYGFRPLEGVATLTLPHLRRLATSRTSFLECLVAPALLELYVHRPVESDLNYALPFLRSSACVLTRLTLFMCKVPVEGIVLLLQGTPSLTALAIDFIPRTATAMDALISAFTIRAGAEHLFRNLTSL